MKYDTIQLFIREMRGNMSQTFFEQMDEIVNKDYVESYQYSEKNFEFIGQILNKLAEYTGGKIGKNICIVDKNMNILNPNQYFRNAIEIGDDCSYTFSVGFITNLPSFNINNSGISFKERGLLPPCGIGIRVSIKQEKDFFTVQGAAFENNQVITESFKIIPDIDYSYDIFLKSIVQVVWKRFEETLENRINQLRQSSSERKSSIGFHIY